MDYARSSLPEAPPGGVTAGIDWASADHVACVVDAAGRVISRFTVPHTAGRALLEAGFTIVVISPNQVKNLRSRYGSAGNKDDRFDASRMRHSLLL